MLYATLKRLRRKYAGVFQAADPAGLPVQEQTPAVAENDNNRSLVEAVGQELGGSGYPSLRGLDVRVCGGAVVPGGCVFSFHQKQLAQAMAQRVAVGRKITNAVEVVSCR